LLTRQSQVLFEVPCNIILKRTTPKIWLPTLMLLWGIVATLLGVAQNYGGFLAARFFLGVTESGLFPGVVFYLSMWYRRTESHYRVALFFSAASLAGAFGGILAYGIGFMKGVGGYAGWRWIFILVCYSQVTLRWPSGGHCRGGRLFLHH
jgi:MFS family permease